MNLNKNRFVRSSFSPVSSISIYHFSLVESMSRPDKSARTCCWSIYPWNSTINGSKCNWLVCCLWSASCRSSGLKFNSVFRCRIGYFNCIHIALRCVFMSLTRHLTRHFGFGQFCPIRFLLGSSAPFLLSSCVKCHRILLAIYLSFSLFSVVRRFLCRLASHRILAFFFFQFSFESTMVKCYWMLLAFSTLCSSCLPVNAGFHNVGREIESMKHWIAKNAS